MYIINAAIDGTITLAGVWNIKTPPPGAIITNRLAGIETDYYDKELKEKANSPIITSKLSMIADGVDTVIFSNVHNPSYLRINGKVISTIEDTEIELSFDIPGSYTIEIKSAPFLVYTQVIDAT